MKFEQLTKLCEEFVDQDYYKNNILKNARKAKELVSALLNKNRPIPDELLDTIMRIEHYYGEDNRYSLLYHVAKDYLDKQQLPPERLVCFLATEFKTQKHNTVDISKKYVQNGFEVPECLMKDAALLTHLALDLATTYIRRQKPVPKPLIMALARSPFDSVRFAKFIMYYHPVTLDVPPVLIKSASKNSITRKELIELYKSHGHTPPDILRKKKKK